MKRKRIIATGLIFLLLVNISLTACKKEENSTSNVETDSSAVKNETTDSNSATDTDIDVKAKDMEALKALTFEEIAAQNVLSADAKENMVYRYVTDTVTIDTDKLIAVTDVEKDALINVVTQVNKALKTGVTDIISADMLNYVLWEMANTPYSWEYDTMEIKGVDAATRLFFVDVTYKTTDEKKTLIPDSVIVRGDSNEVALKAKRYSDYMIWLESQPDYSAPGSKWLSLIESERLTANAMSVFVYGLKYDSVMDGYTVDAQKKAEIATVDTFVDKNVEERSWQEYTFEDRWGSLEDIFATQDGVTLVDRLQQYNKKNEITSTENRENVSEDVDATVNEDVNSETDIETQDNYAEDVTTDGLGVYTYGGLTEVAQDYGATMTFRFVFKYKYSIGTDTDMEIQSLYLYDYNLDASENLINAYTTETIKSADVLLPFINRTIKAYRKAEEESNHEGLYDLFVTYDKYDTYIADLLSYAYISNGGFTVQPIGRKGDEVAVVVTQRTQKRAKGTYMSMPTYQERVLMKVKLCEDDKVRIVSVTILDAILIGEPLSIIRDVTGVSDKIAYDSTAFTTYNASAVENIIGEFEKIQLNYNGTDLDASVYDTIDLGMAITEKAKMLDAFKTVSAINPTQMSVWLTSYETRSNLYCNVKLREVFFGETGNLDAESVIGLLNRNGEWFVISYNRTLTVDTESVKDITEFENSCLALIDKNTIKYCNTTTNTSIIDEGNSMDITSSEEANWDAEQQETPTGIEEQNIGNKAETDSVLGSIQEDVSDTQANDVVNDLF